MADRTVDVRCEAGPENRRGADWTSALSFAPQTRQYSVRGGFSLAQSEQRLACASPAAAVAGGEEWRDAPSRSAWVGSLAALTWCPQFGQYTACGSRAAEQVGHVPRERRRPPRGLAASDALGAPASDSIGIDPRSTDGAAGGMMLSNWGLPQS